METKKNDKQEFNNIFLDKWLFEYKMYYYSFFVFVFKKDLEPIIKVFLINEIFLMFMNYLNPKAFDYLSMYSIYYLLIIEISCCKIKTTI